MTLRDRLGTSLSLFTKKRIGIEVRETQEKEKVKTIQRITRQYQAENDLTKKEDTNVEKTQVEAGKTDVHRYHEKFSNAFPFQTKEQKSHFEPEKTSKLETKNSSR